MYPRRSSTTHTEQLGDEASVYDWAHAQVHALNPTAACVWRLCDGATSPGAIAAAMRDEMGIPEADAVVDLTLKELARLRLVVLPIESVSERPAPTRRWLLGRGLVAAMLPAVYTILTPSPLEAQSPGGAPTLVSVSPNQGTQGTTVAVTLTGTNFIVGATTVSVSGADVTLNSVVVGSSTSLTANFVLGPSAAVGPRTVTVTTTVGTSGGQTFTINSPPPPPAPTLTSVSPNQGTQGTTVAVTLTGTNFVVGATTVSVSGAGVTVNSVVVGGSTSLTASFVLDPAAAVGARTVTVTTAGGTSGGQTFTINLPPVAPTLTNVSPNQGLRGTTVAVTLTGTNFVVGATTVVIGGTGLTVTNVVVGSGTSLTANFVLAPNAVAGACSVRVTTAAGTSGSQTFLITPPPHGSRTFSYTGSPEIFTVPAGVVSITIQATGAGGGAGTGAGGGLGDRMTATVPVTPGASLTVLVGGAGLGTSGGFNGGAAGAGYGGFGGGASSVRNGATSLVVTGGGGGGGAAAGGLSGSSGGRGGAGGGLAAAAGGSPSSGGGGGGGGTQSAGGSGGVRGSATATDGAAGMAGTGGASGADPSGNVGGGGGGGGYFGGGGGGGGNPGIAGGGGGGGGSSFAAPGSTGVVFDPGSSAGNGKVTISW